MVRVAWSALSANVTNASLGDGGLPEENKALLTQVPHRSHEAICNAMRVHRSVIEVQHLGCRVLGNLIDSNRMLPRPLNEAGNQLD